MSFPGKAAQRTWHLIDATDQVVGRLSQQIAPLLTGKYKPTWSANADVGDYVVVVNAGKLKFTGKKMKDKIYYRHTGFPGGIKQRTAFEQMERQPSKVLRSSVIGQIHNNTLRHRHFEKKLLIYDDDKHPHQIELDGVNTLKKVPRALDGTYMMMNTELIGGKHEVKEGEEKP